MLASDEGEHEGQNGDTFSEGHADNGDGKDVTEGTRIAAHCGSSGKADETYADTSASASDTECQGAVDFGQCIEGFKDHII
jgi:hypothetical protein